MSEYSEFINKYFYNNSDVFIKEYATVIYSRVMENNCFTSILLDQSINHLIYNNLDNNYIKFIIRYKNYYNRVLMYFPINDTLGLNFCIRNSIECILKFLYSLIYRPEIEYIKKMSYRNLKDKLLTSKYKDEIQKLCDLYAKLSNDIHGKNKADGGYDYIENIINSKIDYDKYDKILLKVIDIYEDIFICELSLNKTNVLNTHQKMQLRRLKINTKRKEKILKKMDLY